MDLTYTYLKILNEYVSAEYQENIYDLPYGLKKVRK